MKTWRENLFIAMTVLYGVFVVVTISNIVRQEKVNTMSQVLAASTVKFPSFPDAPDPNKVFRLVNEQRANNGLAPLIADETLSKVAESRANDMAARGYYAHKSPDGKYYYDQINKTQFAGLYSCENLDLNFSLEAETYLQDWLKSRSGHRECMLNPSVTHAGYAAVKLELDKTVDFGSYVVVAIHAEAPQR